MLDRSNTQKQIARWAGRAIIGSSLLLFALLLWGASRFVGVSETLTVNVQLGPLTLVEIGKIKTADGFTGTLTYLPGLIWYFGGFVILGVLFGLYQSRK